MLYLNPGGQLLAFFDSLINSKSGLSFSEEYKEYNLNSHVHGKPKINFEDHIDRKVMRFMGAGSAYNYIAMSAVSYTHLTLPTRSTV